ncbi:MAG: DUF4037 domain-containing protein [Candidatus Merdivicinus sp.]|jgi:hypothetical protein
MIKGRILCKKFYQEAVRPILEEYFPQIPYAAGLLGYGSDVLGYDDEVSTDHMWGPRLYLFLNAEDLFQKDNILQVLSQNLPCSLEGYSVNFSDPDPKDHGVRHPVMLEKGPVKPLIWIHTVSGFLQQYLGKDHPEKWNAVDWLICSEHRLLGISAGILYHDGIGMEEQIRSLRFYPELVRDYLLASNWSLIAEEQAFLRRCGDCGDEIGSRLVCGRISERLMRLCFLYCGQYAPYSKWFGTAFKELPIPQNIGDQIRRALSAQELNEREDAMVEAQLAVADLHDRSGLTAPLHLKRSSYFGRNIQVIWADRVAEVLQQKLTETELEGLPLIGSLSEVANFTAIFDHPSQQRRIRSLYES